MQIDQIILYNKIEKILNTLFDVKCPRLAYHYMISKEATIIEYKKYYDFWVYQRPQFTRTIDIYMQNKLIFTREICENKIIEIFEHLENIGLCDQFKEKYQLSPL